MKKVITDLVKSGLTEEQIDKMSQCDIMEAYLSFHGIVGHTDEICGIMGERWRSYHTRKFDERGFEIFAD